MVWHKGGDAHGGAEAAGSGWLRLSSGVLVGLAKEMKWPRGATYTGRALLHANVLFNIGGTKQRSQVIILVTDGCATNTKSLKTTYDHDDGLLLVLSYYYSHYDRTQRLGVCARL